MLLRIGTIKGSHLTYYWKTKTLFSNTSLKTIQNKQDGGLCLSKTWILISALKLATPAPSLSHFQHIRKGKSISSILHLSGLTSKE